ncbi:restriction endonuclease subunit S [Flavobacterium sp. RNTU_13]|uniref:restriction endonuclease subunit S n=1 Tax=Flavobacterium sp. RNTU_13 TaxID=3375145 RepID=UPI003985E5E1
MKINIGRDLYLKGRIGWKGLSKDEYLDEGKYRIINGYSLREGYIDWSIAGYITKERYLESPEIMLKNGDILISKDGTIGKVGIVKNLNCQATVASGIFVLRNIVPEKLDTEYLFQYLKSNNFKNFINGVKAEGSTINHLYQRDLIKLEIEVPSVIYQRKITSILLALDNKIELNNKMNDELESIAKTLYDYWFVQFDFPDANGKPYKSSGGKMVWNETLKREIPEGWEVKKLSSLVEVKDGTHDSPKYISDEGYPLITSKNLKKTGIDFTETNRISKFDFDLINQRSKVDTGDILFSMIGNIGTVYKIEEEIINFAIKNVALFKTSSNPVIKNYLFQYLHGYDMQRYVPNVISGSIQKFIALGSLRNTPILFKKAIIEEFNNISFSIYSKLKNNLRQNQELAQLRDWLLPMLMNGQITVGEAEVKIGMVAEEGVEYKKR